MSMSTEAPFSELINHPKATVAKLSSVRELLLRRRDADDLVLTTAMRAEQDAEMTSATTRIFVAMMKHDGAVLSLLVDVVPEVFPWVRFLPAEDVRAFVVELVETLRAADAVDNSAPVATVIAAWRHTAEVYADPELYAQLNVDAADHGPATEPPPA